MHSIIDIAQEMYPDLEVCVLDTIKHDQQLIDDAIVTWKKKNCKVLVYCLDNFVNDSKHIEHFKSEYENFAYTTPGLHKDDRHISNIDYLTRFTSGKDHPKIGHLNFKKYTFVFLVGKLHQHRKLLLETLAKRGILKHTLLSLRNPDHAYEHLLPRHSVLPKEYEWPDILEVGDFKAGWLDRHSPMAIAFNKNIGMAHPKLYKDTGFSIVSETNIDEDINYITEKTWTPMVAEHFIIGNGNKGNNDFLERLGFQIYNDFLPHYDESDHIEVGNICENILGHSITSVYKHTEKQRKHNRNLALDEQHWKDYHRAQLKSYFEK